jgi:hypothetical protein
MMEKFLSGRFISTLVVVGVYAYCAINNILDLEFVKTVTMVVLYAYFTKQRTEAKETK